MVGAKCTMHPEPLKFPDKISSNSPGKQTEPSASLRHQKSYRAVLQHSARFGAAREAALVGAQNPSQRLELCRSSSPAVRLRRRARANSQVLKDTSFLRWVCPKHQNAFDFFDFSRGFNFQCVCSKPFLYIFEYNMLVLAYVKSLQIHLGFGAFRELEIMGSNYLVILC